MQKDEVLSEAVREFPCIYDKSHKGHKDKVVAANAWKKVMEKVDYCATAEQAIAAFGNLKRRYQKC